MLGFSWALEGLWLEGFGRLRVEGELIRELKPSLNKQVEGRTMKESMEDNKIKVVDNQKLYYEKNKDQVNERKKQYMQEHGE